MRLSAAVHRQSDSIANSAGRITKATDYSPSDLLCQGQELRRVGTASSLRQAAFAFQRAAALFGEVKNYQYQSRSLNAAGEVWFILGDLARAINADQSAAKISHLASDKTEEAKALNYLSEALRFQGKTTSAIADARAALRKSVEANDSRETSAAYKNLGEAFHALSDDGSAIDYLQKSLAISTDTGDAHGQAYAEYALGYVYDDLGQMSEAKQREQRALSLWQALGESRGEALTLKEIGAIALNEREPQKALDVEFRALEMFKVSGDRLSAASTDLFLGAVMEQLGEPEIAIDFHQRALVLYRDLQSRVGEALAMSELGHTYSGMGKTKEAANYSRLWIQLSFELGDLRQESMALTQLGGIEFSAGQMERASDLYRRALSISKRAGDPRAQADALLHLGEIETQLGSLHVAIADLAEVRRLGDKISDPQVKVLALYELGRIGSLQNDLWNARSCLEAAIDIVEAERGDVASRDLRASFLASVHDLYALYVDVLMRMHRATNSREFLDLAFETSERGRARSLLESLSSDKQHVAIDPDLLEREGHLRDRLNAKAQEQLRLQTMRHTPESATSLARDVRSIALEYHEVEGLIDQKLLDSQLSKSTLSAKAIQGHLDNSTVLLEYSLGDLRSYLWLVTSDSITPFELPSRATLEKQVQGVLQLLTNGPLLDQQKENQSWLRSSKLSSALLGPVAKLIQGKRLVVVPDGTLSFLPFGALPCPGPQKTGEARHFLGVEHEIVAVTSASVALALRARHEKRLVPAKTVIVFADPVFDASDSRVRSFGTAVTKQSGPAPNFLATRSGWYNTGWNGVVPRLPATRAEAEFIRSMVPEGEADVALDFQASRAAVLKSSLQNYRIVHFATHAVIDTETPDLSGIILSLVDENGRSQDGFLRVDDVQGLSLAADLVVLSACETSLGRQLRGEGVLGLNQGFLRGGADSVLSSAWKVDDEATAALMERFYRNILESSEAPPAALRSAQSWMRAQERWNQPYYWAAFALEGDWAQQ